MFDLIAHYQPPKVVPENAAPYQPMTSGDLPIAFGKSIAVFGIVFLYGVYRGWLFQPFQDPYRSWLIRSPWTAEQKLPLGPMQLCLADLIVVALLAIPIWGNWLTVGTAGFWFLSAYVLSQLAVFYHANQLWKLWGSFAIVAAAFLVPIPDLIWSLPLAVAVVFAILYRVQHTALKRLRLTEQLMETEVDQKNGTSSSPFGYAIGPNLRAKWKSDTYETSLACCIVWSLFCYGVFVRKFDPTLTLFLMMAPCAIAAILGLIRIRPCANHVPPVDRLRSLRFILPKYDIIFVAPLSMMTVAIGATIVGLGWQIPAEYLSPATTAIVFLMFEYIPPDAEQWKTKGGHRIAVSKLVDLKRSGDSLARAQR